MGKEKDSDRGLDISMKNEVMEKMIMKLERSDLDINVIINSSDLPLILPRADLLEAEEDAYQRFRKFIAKAGKGLNDFQKLKTALGFRIKALIEYGVKNILSYYGIGGSIVSVYIALASRVMKRLKEKKLRYWSKILADEITTHAAQLGLDPKIAKVVVLASAIIVFNYFHGDLIKFPFNYPELATQSTLQVEAQG